MKKRVSRRTTLKDIANNLNVSVALVSYVMNNKVKEGRVGAAMAKKINEEAKRLNYRPNHAAKTLKHNRQLSIGCIVADISNPFFAELSREVENQANKLGYTVIFASYDEDRDRFNGITDFLLSRQLDGFLIAPPEDCEKDILAIKELNIPTVLFDRYYEDLGVNCVVLDNYSGAKEIVESLFEDGHKKIGMVAYDSEMLHFQQRKAGYIDALKKWGATANNSLLKRVDFKNVRADVHRAIEELVSKDVDAIFFETNILILEGLKYLSTNGFQMPGSFGIAAFDESDVYYFFDPAIRYIKQPLKEMATTAVETLIKQIENGETMSPEVKFLKPTIIYRYAELKSKIKG